MKNVVLEVNKIAVYENVAEASAYVGSKSDNDKDFDKVSSVDEDRALFEGFWVEASDVATNVFRPFLESVSGNTSDNGLHTSENYSVTLNAPDNFDDNVTESMKTSLFSYFAAYIKSKWFAVVKEDKEKEYAATANLMLEDVKQKMYNRKKPKRR